MDWNTTPVRVPLTYLRVTLLSVDDFIAIMATSPLSRTLRQLHLKLCDNGRDLSVRVSDMLIAFCMSSLCTFSFVKPLYWQFADEWTFLDALTSSTVMPVLQRAKLIAAIHVSDLDQIGRSALFNDHRCVDVQYAFILDDRLSHTDLDQRIPRGSRAHPRSVASATFVRDTSNDHRPDAMPGKFYVSSSSHRCSSTMPTKRARISFFSRDTFQVDLIYGTLCHGLSTNSLNCRFQTRKSVNWKSCNLFAH